MSLGEILVRYGGTLLAVTFGALAAWRGGWPERSAAAIVLADWFISPLVQTTYSPGLPLIVVDLIEVVAVIAVSHFSRRIWAVVLAACTVAGLFADLTDALAPHQHKMAWAFVVSAEFLGGLFVAFCLGLATWEVEYTRKIEAQIHAAAATVRQ